jgi:3-hydroxy acid dehydrogenase / malonic semialdehyde reductase
VKKRIALITGATSGFGKAAAQKLAAEGFDLILTGRRSELLKQLSEELTQSFQSEVLTLSFDVRKRKEVVEAFNTVTGRWTNIDVLINNAGLALGRAPFHEADMDDWEQMIDTNLKGLLYVSETVVPWMIREENGIIINIGSVAGRDMYPGGNVYSATKAAVDALTKSMRIDLLRFNIRVSQIAPGAAETEFSLVRFKGDEEKAKAAYSGFLPLMAEDIAEAIWFIVSRPEHVCIQDMLIMCRAQASANIFHKNNN